MTAKSAGSAVITAKTTDGEKTATCTVTVGASGASSVATLSYLILFRDDLDSPTPISPDFDADTVSYTSMFVIPNSVSAVSVLAAATDAGATISGDGARTLAVGANSLSVLVTAADGVTTKTYTIDIERESESLSESAYLASLSASGLSIDFDKATNSYSVNAPYALATTTITAAPEFSGSTMEYKVVSGSYTPPDYVSFDGSKDVALTEGDETIVYLKVTSEYSNDYLTYSISIAREGAGVSTDATLSGLTIHETNGSGPVVALDPIFDAATMTYSATVSSEISSVDVSAVTNDPGAGVIVSGNTGFAYGPNSVNISVTASDGETSLVYSVHITRSSAPHVTIVNPIANGTVPVGTITLSGTYSAPGNEISTILVNFGASSGTTALFSDGTFSASINAGAELNGTRKLIVIARDAFDTTVASACIDVIMTGSTDGHSVFVSIALPNEATTTSGYMTVIVGDSYIVYLDIPLDSVIFPCAIEIPDLPSGSLSISAYIKNGSYLYNSNYLFYGLSTGITIDGSDYNAGTLTLSGI